MLDFGGWLKAELKRQKISQFELSVRTETGQGNISRWIHGEASPKLGTLQKVLGELGYHIEIISNKNQNG